MARPNTAAVRLLAGEREPVLVATTANVTLSGLQTIDGVTVVAGDRVLVKDQTDATENGIYEASSGTWYRAADARSSRTINKGVTVHVQSGTVNEGRVYAFQTLAPDIGDDDIDIALYLSDDFAVEALALTTEYLLQISNAADSILASVTNPVFASKIAAQAYNPVTAPGYIVLTGYYAAGDLRDQAVYAKLGSIPSPVKAWHIQIAEGSYYELRTNHASVRMFGAKGDNTNDDTTAIQAAVDYAVRSGANGTGGSGVVTFPPGVFKVTATINVNTDSSLTVRGAALGLNSSGSSYPGTVIKPAIAAASQNLFNVDHTAPIVGGPILFEDITFDTPTGAGAATIVGIQATNALIRLNRLIFDGYLYHYRCTGSFATEITHCEFVRSRAYSLFFDDSDAGNGNASVIFANKFFVNGITNSTSAIRINGSGIAIVGNDLEGNFVGLELHEANGVIVHGNYFEQNDHVNMIISGSSNSCIDVVGNTFVNGGTFANGAMEWANVTGVNFNNNQVSNLALTFAATALDVTVGTNRKINSATIGAPPATAPSSYANNWTAGAVAPGYRKLSSGLVVLKGVLTSGVGSAGNTAFTLPLGYRPVANAYYPSNGTNATFCSIYVGADGTVAPQTAPGGGALLDGITFQPAP